MSNKKKIINLSIVLFIVMLLVSGSSFAYWTWITASSERTNVAVFLAPKEMEASLAGYTQTITNLIPVSSCTDETYAIKKQLTLTYMNLSANDAEVLGTLKIENFVSPNGVPDSEDLSHLHYAVTLSPDSCTTESINGMSGTFSSTTGNLFTGKRLAGPIPTGTNEASMTFYLWVWLDSEYTHQNVGSGVTSDPMQNISFTLIWEGEMKNDLLPRGPEPEVPVLDDGMIPVTIANDGTVTTIAEDDPAWYDYANKEWANVVLVNEEVTVDVEGSQSREYYSNNLSNNVEVNQSDILAYYVWIPRYKYKIWDVTGTSNPQSINIEFESLSADAAVGTAVGEWRTHPAFIWDGDLVSGIWLGKFETSFLPTSTCYTSPSKNNCNNTNQTPRVLPNAVPAVYQSVINSFIVSLKFSGGVFSNGIVTFNGSDTYGLTADTDSHMMKNSEWGAVAYLSHSQYGINDEIRINNYYNEGIFRTGCGAFEADSAEIAECEITYGEANSYPQSTTGNISGVFDISGGVYEYVMGIYDNYAGSSGFTTMPETKYFDTFSSDNALTACDNGICYGHALSETILWHNNVYRYFNSTTSTWFIRGGCAGNNSAAGAWLFYNVTGGAYASDGYRSALVLSS